MPPMEALLYFNETKNVNVNVNLLTSTTPNNQDQDLNYVLHFVKVKQQTQYIWFAFLKKKQELNEKFKSI